MATKDAGFPIEPPIEPMLAKLATELPAGEGWLFEPKWDGFRAIVFRDRDRFFTRDAAGWSRICSTSKSSPWSVAITISPSTTQRAGRAAFRAGSSSGK